MPRERRRRRRGKEGGNAKNTGPANAEQRQPAAGRAWWMPTLGVATAFFAGLWLGGLLSVTETASAVALLGGSLGLGVTLARRYGDWLRERRRQRIRPAGDDDQA